MAVAVAAAVVAGRVRGWVCGCGLHSHVFNLAFSSKNVASLPSPPPPLLRTYTPTTTLPLPSRRLLVGESSKVLVRGVAGQTPFSFFGADVTFSWASTGPDVRGRVPASW
jgi:hypothetical protein